MYHQHRPSTSFKPSSSLLEDYLNVTICKNKPQMLDNKPATMLAMVLWRGMAPYGLFLEENAMTYRRLTLYITIEESLELSPKFSAEQYQRAKFILNEEQQKKAVENPESAWNIFRDLVFEMVNPRQQELFEGIQALIRLRVMAANGRDGYLTFDDKFYMDHRARKLLPQKKGSRSQRIPAIAESLRNCTLLTYGEHRFPYLKTIHKVDAAPNPTSAHALLQLHQRVVRLQEILNIDLAEWIDIR